MENKPIYVTQPALAPLEELFSILKGAWDSGILTHNGPLVQKFENDLAQKLQIRNFVVVTNGTIALQMAIKALKLKGEIITTPFTWVATISAIKWEGCVPVFCDIDPETFNIDPERIKKLITKKTSAIMPVHVFGNPCDVIAIGKIAEKNNLKVIYDAAHAIGSTFNGRSILEYGNISATSLHATKVFNTAEGGGCVTTDENTHNKLKRIRFFGHSDNKDIIEDGFNGKMTEVHAALGLANLKYLDEVLSDRKEKYKHYLECLDSTKGISFQDLRKGNTNYSYFPVVFKKESILMEIVDALNRKNIFPRRYFYPSLNTYKKIVAYKSMRISEDISKRILCLPLFWKISLKDIELISKIISDKLK